MRAHSPAALWVAAAYTPLAGAVAFMCLAGVPAIPALRLPVLSDIAWAINLLINIAITAFVLYILILAKKGR